MQLPAERRAREQREVHSRVISSGNPLDAITIAASSSSRFLQEENLLQLVTAACHLRRAIGRSRAKLGKNRWKWILIDFFFLPPFLLKFSHAKLCKKGQRNRFFSPSEKDYFSFFSAHLPLFCLVVKLTMFPDAVWFFAARPLCKGNGQNIRTGTESQA